MPESIAIRFKNVSKIYKLHGSQLDQLIEVLGLQRFGLRPKTTPKEFAALQDLSFEIPRGHRIGIVGRNGAGKTTLLKLISGNFTPTLGTVEVYGGIQALMNVGLGFHPEYTGRQNVEASLQYNGLGTSEYKTALEGVIDFCELGDFLDQPFKTYSLGMQARLMFAAATAIKPDILIIDEVLGAGDAYFVAKSKARIESLVSSGCTMLLVSHSMQQILELCNEAMWIENGSIKMQDSSFKVVKAYEEAVYGSIKSLTPQLETISLLSGNNKGNGNAKNDLNENSHNQSFEDFKSRERFNLSEELLLQTPTFIPHKESPIFPAYHFQDVLGFHYVAQGGISRWDSEPGVKVVGFTISTENGFSNSLLSLRPAKFIVSLVSEIEGEIFCRYGILISDMSGNIVSRIFSPPDRFVAKKQGVRIIEIVLNPVQLGPGEYVLGFSVTDATKIELVNSAKRYDLLNRSFEFSIKLENSLAPLSTSFFHSAEWMLGVKSL